MKFKSFFLVSAIFLVSMILTSNAYADQKRVLFYEKSSKYKIEKDYAMFKEALERRGFIVESLDIPLSREVLESRDPDVLIIASLKSSLSSNELATIFEYVMQKGGSLFILGGSTGRGLSPANQITIPFGMTLDSAILEDERNPVVAGTAPTTKKSEFVVKKLNYDDQTVRVAIQGVNEVAFFEGPGIVIPDNSEVKVVATCSSNAYSPGSQIFQKGSNPPIAAAAIVGNGLIFVLSDEDMLTDKYLDTSKYKYDNLKFGTNIVTWLYTVEMTSNVSRDINELSVVYGECLVEYEEINDTLLKTKNALAVVTQEQIDLGLAYDSATQELGRLKEQVDPFIGINYMYWAIGILGVAILVLSVIVAGKRKGKGPESDEKEGEVFGYEFEEGFEGDESGNSDLSDVGDEVAG